MALIPNKDFSCNSSGCKPLNDAAKKLYARLQNELNRFAPSKGFALLVPDGIIGPKTAEAAIAVMPEKFMTVGASLPFMTTALEQVRVKQAIAAIAVDPDKFYAVALQKGVGLPPAATPSPSIPIVPPVPTTPGGSPPLPPPSSGIPTWYWLAGGAGLLAIGVGTYFLLKG